MGTADTGSGGGGPGDAGEAPAHEVSGVDGGDAGCRARRVGRMQCPLRSGSARGLAGALCHLRGHGLAAACASGLRARRRVLRGRL